jgi:Cyclin
MEAILASEAGSAAAIISNWTPISAYDGTANNQLTPEDATIPASRQAAFSSLALLTERKRKGVSPVAGVETLVGIGLAKRQRHPADLVLGVLGEARVTQEWVQYTEQVTPEHGSAWPDERPRSRLVGGLLPRQFEDDTQEGDEGTISEDEVVDAITNILKNICLINNSRVTPRSANGTIPSRAPYRSATYPDGSSSIFFSLQKPAVEMHAYVSRLVKYMHVSKSVFVVALIYLDRVHAADEILALTDLNVHRLITTALAVACKYFEDEVHRNSTVSRIGGVPSTAEMNLLEVQFLRRINWECAVSIESYELYKANVFKRSSVAALSNLCPGTCSMVGYQLEDDANSQEDKYEDVDDADDEASDGDQASASDCDHVSFRVNDDGKRNWAAMTAMLSTGRTK